MTRAALIVCTRNRPEDVRRLLASVGVGNRGSTILVVDSSDDDTTRSVVEEFMELSPIYERSAPGLTRQRMAGIALLDADVDIVHFVDDDVVLEPGYLAAIDSVFGSEPEVLGVGGRITNLPEHNPHLFRRVFLFDSTRGGAVLRSGVNVLPFDVPDRGRVSWLSGCSMSFRRTVFHDMSFDTRMDGYSLGEDVDFTFRVAQKGLLCIAGEARLAHLCSPTNRAARHELARREIVHRYVWVSEMRGHGVDLLSFWWSVSGDIVLNMTKGVLWLRRDPIRRSLALIAAIGDIARVGRVVRNDRLYE